MGSYSGIVEIATNPTLVGRITAAAAAEGIDNPTAWAAGHMWEIAAQPGWSDDWDYAKDNATVNTNPDLGARNDVVSDAKILAAVQTLKAAEDAEQTPAP